MTELASKPLSRAIKVCYIPVTILEWANVVELNSLKAHFSHRDFFPVFVKIKGSLRRKKKVSRTSVGISAGKEMVNLKGESSAHWETSRGFLRWGFHGIFSWTPAKNNRISLFCNHADSPKGSIHKVFSIDFKERINSTVALIF